MDKKNQQGITIVVLVITIIILLILAGVSVRTLARRNAVRDAQDLKEKTDNYLEQDQDLKNSVRNLYE